MNQRPTLNKQGIILVRSVPHGPEIEEGLQQQGADTTRLPLFSIESTDSHTAVNADAYEGLIFTSRNAVTHAPDIQGSTAHLLAVGPATAHALANRGFENISSPTDSRSEGLLQLPVLQNVADQHWLIIKGLGGRDHLQKELQARGAKVSNLEVYKRLPLQAEPSQLQAGLSGRNIWLVFSGELLEQLCEQCPDNLNNQLFDQQLVVPSQRVVKMAQDMGFRKPVIAVENMSKAGIITTLLKHFGSPPANKAGA